MDKISTRLYLITPPAITDAFYDQLKLALDAGDVAALQLRLKPATDEEILRAAEKMLPLCEGRDMVFIINDRPDLALKSGADGVHLGDEDMSVADARKLLGDDAIIGASCYASKHRAMEAAEQSADYVAFGAFYETKTKTPKGRPTPDLLKWWHDFTVIPSVAIGGIKPENSKPLVKAKAGFIAVVTGVWDYPEGAAKAVKAYNKAILEAS